MRLLFKKVLSYIPTPVPTGMTKFDAYVKDIIELSGPIASPDDIEWVVDDSKELLRKLH
jgi:hypothetical protein